MVSSVIRLLIALAWLRRNAAHVVVARSGAGSMPASLRICHVAAGHLTTYQDLADAVAAALPGTRLDLPQGHDEQLALPRTWLDVTRLRDDTGYQPGYDTRSAVADYVAWLQAGNER